MEKQLQIAIDLLDFDKVIDLATKVAPYFDIIEIGTPCIKYNGIALLKKLKELFPNNKILVDLKTMDAGEYEASPFFEAGGDICTVLGTADIETIKGVIKAANKYGKDCQVDLINVTDKVARAKEVVESGAHIIGIHTGLDQQAKGKTPFTDLADIKKLNLDAKISVAGGIKPSTILHVVDAGADIIVVGAAVYTASDPAETARTLSLSVK